MNQPTVRDHLHLIRDALPRRMPRARTQRERGSPAPPLFHAKLMLRAATPAQHAAASRGSSATPLAGWMYVCLGSLSTAVAWL